jgi:hypothetical protein
MLQLLSQAIDYSIFEFELILCRSLLDGYLEIRMATTTAIQMTIAAVILLVVLGTGCAIRGMLLGSG